MMQACDMCRQLKAKCDELKPCKSCKEKKVECKYREAIPKQCVSPPPSAFFFSLPLSHPGPGQGSRRGRLLTPKMLGKIGLRQTSWILFWHCRNRLTSA